MIHAGNRMITLTGIILFSDSKKSDEAKSKKRKGAKNSETAAKVALMKLKMHASGDKSLPQVSDVCFQ